MFNLDQKIERALGNKEFCFFGRARMPRMVCFISDIGTCGINLSLTHGTAKFKLD